MQLCAVDVRINCWARISVGEAGLGVAWLGWRAAESNLGDHPPLPCSMGGAGGAGWPQVKGLEVSSVFSGNLGHFNAFEDDPPGHICTRGRLRASCRASLIWPGQRGVFHNLQGTVAVFSQTLQQTLHLLFAALSLVHLC